MTIKKPAARGRPLTGPERKQPHQVMLLPEVADKLRALGHGNLSGGITLALVMAEYWQNDRKNS